MLILIVDNYFIFQRRMRIKQAIVFRLYNPARYLSDLINLKMANLFSKPQSLNANNKPIKVLITSDNKAYTSEQQFAPIIANRKQLKQRFRVAVNQMLIQDVLNLPASFVGNYDAIFLKMSFRIPADEAEQIVKRLYAMKGEAKLVYFDGDDDACVQWPEMLPYVDLYVKKSTFADRDQYKKEFIGKSNLTDYVASEWNESFSDDIIPTGKPVNPLYFDKIVLGYNIGLDDKIMNLYQTNLVYPQLPKDNDILCRATIPASWMKHLRKNIIPELQKMASQCRILIPDKRVDQEQYYDELRRSKISVSPFGYGEICWRDFESVLCKCLLIKPDMSHIKTAPDIFVPHKTYVPVKWDFSDLQEKCSYYLEHEDEREKIVEQAYTVLSEYYREEKFISFFGDLLKKLGFS